MGAIVFMDTETLGLDKRAPIWDFAAIRVNEDGTEEEYQWFLTHDRYKYVVGTKLWETDLPAEFREDYHRRWSPDLAIHPGEMKRLLNHIYRPNADGSKVHTVGAVPNFDTERIERLLGHEGPWHYHLIDIENLIAGVLCGLGLGLSTDGWKSDELSRIIGVEPDDFARHTALGDVLWEKAQWDVLSKIGALQPGEYVPGVRDGLVDIYRGVRTGLLQVRDVPGALRDIWTGYDA